MGCCIGERLDTRQYANLDGAKTYVCLFLRRILLRHKIKTSLEGAARVDASYSPDTTSFNNAYVISSIAFYLC